MILGTMIRRMLGRDTDVREVPRELLRRAQEALDADRMNEAATAISAALASDPSHPGTYVLRAELARRERRFPAAIADLRRASVLDPESVAVRIDLSTVLHRMGCFEEALSALDEVLDLAPADAMAHFGRGLMLRELGRFAQAHSALARAVELDPTNRDARCHLAAMLYDQGERTQANALLAAVLAEDPDHVEAHWVSALHRLSEADFASGWRHYAYRLHRRDASLQSRPLPWWEHGAGSCGHLLVLAEQGLGDEIMFASCFGDLLRKVPGCTIECDPRLGPLLARSYPEARVLATRDPQHQTPDIPEGVVAQVAAGSLPGLYRTSLQDFPEHQGYLRADPERTHYWRERLRALGTGLKVGLSWVGGGVKTRRAMRSLALRDLAPVLRVPGACFVSLQYTDCENEISQLAQSDGLVLHHWPDAISDYDQTASLVAALDLVISVTTSLVHLSGALGKPVWVLVPEIPEWRYLRSGDAMPWYPSARLYRQRKLGDWREVVAEVEAGLRAATAGSRRTAAE